MTQSGQAGLTDAIRIIEEVGGTRDPGLPFFAPAADLNRDGNIGLTDAILVQEKVAGVPRYDEGEITVSNLNAPGIVQSGSDITVSADLENLGDEGALQNISFRIAPEGETLDENDTLDEKFVDMAVSGVSNPVDRPAQTTIEFTNLTVNLPEGNYTHGVFSEDDSVTGTINVEASNGSLDGTVTNVTTSQSIEGATVEVFESGQNGQLIGSDTTDANGDYNITQLPVGDHFVTVTVDGAVAGSDTVTIQGDTATTKNFDLEEASFGVSILSAPNTTAGSTQSFDVEITNNGDLVGTQTVSLDWGSGQYSDSVTETLAGGDSVTRALSVTLAGTQPIAFYDVNVSSSDNFDTAQIVVGAERSLNTTSPAPGQTVEVTVTGEVDPSAAIDLAETWNPNADSSEFISSNASLSPIFEGPGEIIVGSQSEFTGSLTITYHVTVPSGASDGDTFTWEPLENGDGSLIRLTVNGDENLFPVLGDEEFQVSN